MTGQNDSAVEAHPSDPPTIAITGAAGYIGSRVVKRLQAVHPEWQLIGIDNQYRGQVEAVGDLEIRHVDIRDRGRLEAALDGADVVLHLAAVSGVDDCASEPDLAYEVNVTGTNNVAWFCHKTGAALAFPFSMAVLGDPQSFPITADLPRDPLNWYGRTKLLGERSIKTLADGTFPAHLFIKSNLYGEHMIDGTTVSKPTVINFFVGRAKADESLTVYEPGTQARNFIHVKDVAEVYVDSVEQLLDGLRSSETGVETYEVASDEDPSVLEVANTVARLANDELGIDLEMTLVENPRAGETMAEQFDVDTSKIRREFDWEPTRTIEESIRELLLFD
jgi:UDP-glucose 4-epimerase